MTRVAVYAIPGVGSDGPVGILLRERAEAWLGRSVVGGSAAPAPGAPAGWTRAEVDAVTVDARRYGFHGTLKAPFRLADGHDLDGLEAAVADLAGSRDPVALSGLRVASLGGFLALVPTGPVPALDALAADVVMRLDGFRAPPTDAETARRDPASLSPRQRELLATWGYPHVLDRFRFHLTLTDRIPAAARPRAEAALAAWFAAATDRPVAVDALALVVEDAPGARPRRTPMSRETVLRNARIVLDDEVLRGSVLIRDGLVADISPGTAGEVGGTGDDLDGDLLIPGLVELHTDHLESHAQPRPGTRWDPIPAVLAHDAQLSGAGVTTVFDAIRIGTLEGRDDATTLSLSLAEAIEHAVAAGLLRAEHLIHLRCEVAAPGTVAEFREFDRIASVRLASLMDHTPGQRQYADVEAFSRYMVGRGRVSQAGIGALMEELQDVAAEHSTPNRIAIAELATARGVTLAAHDDATVAHVEESAALGVRISEFPTTEVAARAAREHGQLIVMGAPNIVRGGSQSGNVAAAELLALGLLDVLSSDYVPASPLQAIVQLDADGILPITRGVRLVSGDPARAVGLDDRGSIRVGARADLVRVHRHVVPASERHPGGRTVPVVRGVHLRGARVS